MNTTEIISREAVNAAHPIEDNDLRNYFEGGFMAGASFLEAMLQPFGQWLLEKAWVVTKGVYEIDGEKGQFTMEELIQKYFADNKQKDEVSQNKTV